MPSRRPSAPTDAVVMSGRLAPPSVRTVVLLLLPILFVVSVAVARAALVHPRPTLPGQGVGAEDATPAQVTEAAADTLDAALTQGAGITFEIVQRQVLVAPEGGPPLEIPDPADRDKSFTAGRYELHILVQRGAATPDGFWAEILAGPPPDDLAKYDPDEAEVRREALVRDGKAFRNDGAGWYPTDALPGIGLDPETLAKLPGTIREAPEVKDAERSEPAEGLDTVGGLKGPETESVRALEAELKAADLPGVIAIDALEATDIVEPATYRFDEQGRLVGLTVIARNTAMDRAELIVETSYAFRYPDQPPILPDPEPRWQPTPAPADETEE